MMLMSAREGPTLGRLATNFLGVVLLALGMMLAYFSINADIDLVSPRMFTPLGIAIVLIGGLMIIARKDGVE
jgi:hypothetical protein